MEHWEQIEQEAVTKYMRTKWPNVLWSASVGGLITTIGQRVKMHKMGYNKGIPDILIFEPRKGYHGLYIELKKSEKYGASVLSKEQKQWISNLNSKGYLAMCCKGKHAAIQEIYKYLS